jgi:hypothetical protein
MPIRGSPNGARSLLSTAPKPMDAIARNRWTPSLGMEVDAINRYSWTSSIGIVGRHHSVRPLCVGTLSLRLARRPPAKHAANAVPSDRIADIDTLTVALAAQIAALQATNVGKTGRA